MAGASANVVSSIRETKWQFDLKSAGLPVAAKEAGAAAADILAKSPTTASAAAQDALKLLAGLLAVSKGCVPSGILHILYSIGLDIIHMHSGLLIVSKGRMLLPILVSLHARSQ